MPDNLTPAEKEELALLKIAIKTKNQAWLLKRHYHKYQCLSSNFVGEGWSQANFLKRLKEFKNSNPAKTLTHKSRARRSIISNRNKLFEEYKKDQKIKNLILAVRIFTDLNEYRKEFFHVLILIPEVSFQD